MSPRSWFFVTTFENIENMESFQIYSNVPNICTFCWEMNFKEKTLTGYKELHWNPTIKIHFPIFQCQRHLLKGKQHCRVWAMVAIWISGIANTCARTSKLYAHSNVRSHTFFIDREARQRRRSQWQAEQQSSTPSGWGFFGLSYSFLSLEKWFHFLFACAAKDGRRSANSWLLR